MSVSGLVIILKPYYLKIIYGEAKQREPKFIWTAEFCAELCYARHLDSASDLLSADIQ